MVLLERNVAGAIVNCDRSWRTLRRSAHNTSNVHNGGSHGANGAVLGLGLPASPSSEA